MLVAFIFLICEDHLVLAHTLTSRYSVDEEHKPSVHARKRAIHSRISSRLASLEGNDMDHKKEDPKHSGNDDAAGGDGAANASSTATETPETTHDNDQLDTKPPQHDPTKLLDNGMMAAEQASDSATVAELVGAKRDENPYDVWLGPFHVITFEGKPFCPMNENGDILPLCQHLAEDLKIVSFIMLLGGLSVLARYIAKKNLVIYSIIGEVDDFGMFLLSVFLLLMSVLCFSISEALLQGYYGFFIILVWMVKIADMVLSKATGGAIKRHDISANEPESAENSENPSSTTKESSASARKKSKSGPESEGATKETKDDPSKPKAQPEDKKEGTEQK